MSRCWGQNDASWKKEKGNHWDDNRKAPNLLGTREKGGTLEVVSPLNLLADIQEQLGCHCLPPVWWVTSRPF